LLAGSLAPPLVDFSPSLLLYASLFALGGYGELKGEGHIDRARVEAIAGTLRSFHYYYLLPFLF